MRTEDIKAQAKVGDYILSRMQIKEIDYRSLSMMLRAALDGQSSTWLLDSSVVAIEKAVKPAPTPPDPPDWAGLSVVLDDTIPDDKVYDVIAVDKEIAWVRHPGGGNCFYTLSALRAVPAGIKRRPVRPFAVGDTVKFGTAGSCTYKIIHIHGSKAWLHCSNGIEYIHEMRELVLVKGQ